MTSPKWTWDDDDDYLDYDYHADDDDDGDDGGVLTEITQCQNPDCRSKPENTYPTRVCHHLDCQSINNNRPFRLCGECDSKIHTGDQAAHVRFNFTLEGSATRDTSDYSDLDSLPTTPCRQQSPGRETNLADRLYEAGARRLHKKKTPRRHNTDELGKEWFTLRVGDIDEVIPALQGQSLREALRPAFERHRLSFEKATVYLRSSTTPLDWSFETYFLRGQNLRVEIASNGKPADKGGLMSSIVRHLTRPRSPQVSRKDKEKDKFKEHFFKNASHLAMSKRALSDSDAPNMQRCYSVPSHNARRGTGHKDIRQLLGVDAHRSLDTDIAPSFPSTTTTTTTATTTADPTTTTTIEERIGDALVNGVDPRRTNKIQSMLGSGFSNQMGRSLTEQLQFFSVYGLPGYDGEKIDLGKSEEARLGSWKNHVLGVESMTKRECDQQEAIWELLSTEESYMLALKAVLEVFYVCVEELKKEQLIEIEAESMFGNIAYVYSASKAFWEKRLKPIVDGCRETRERIDPLQVVNALAYFDEDLEPYEEFCVREKDCVDYLTAQKKESADFKAYLEWCEFQPRCRRMKLADLLVKPMHRLIQYPLLLKAIMKKSDDEEALDKLTTLIERVECFLNRVNTMVGRQGQEEKLRSIRAMISGYVGFDCPPELEKHFSSYFALDLLGPMPGVPEYYGGIRDVYQEGSLKLKESFHSIKAAKSEVHAFLFTDLFLLTTKVKKGRVKLLQQPMRVDRLVCEKLKDSLSFLLIYLNEYRFPVGWYVFQAPTPDKAKHWMDALQDAQVAYAGACRGIQLHSPPGRRRGGSVTSVGGSSRTQSFSRTPSPSSSRRSTAPVRRSWSSSPSSSPLPTLRSNTISHVPPPSKSLPSLLVTDSGTLTDIQEDVPTGSNGEGSGVSESSFDRMLDALPDSSCDENESLSDASSLDRRSMTLEYVPPVVTSPLIPRRTTSVSDRSSYSSVGDARASPRASPRNSASCDDLDVYGQQLMVNGQAGGGIRPGKARERLPQSKFVWRNREMTLSSSNV